MKTVLWTVSAIWCILWLFCRFLNAISKPLCSRSRPYCRWPRMGNRRCCVALPVSGTDRTKFPALWTTCMTWRRRRGRSSQRDESGWRWGCETAPVQPCPISTATPTLPSPHSGRCLFPVARRWAGTPLCSNSIGSICCGLVISAKWTEWNLADILFHFCVSVCLSVRTQSHWFEWAEWRIVRRKM